MKRHVIVICFLAVCFWSTPGVNGAELRTWTSKSGKFTVKAELHKAFPKLVISRSLQNKRRNQPSQLPRKLNQQIPREESRKPVHPVRGVSVLGLESY